MAATVPVETEGETHPLLDEAQRIGSPPDEDNDARTAQPAAATAEPKLGSYERFMASFGSPQKWAGR